MARGSGRRSVISSPQGEFEVVAGTEDRTSNTTSNPSICSIRTPVQVKTHAQQILRKIASGETTVFELLESDDSTVTSLTSEATDWTSVVPTKTLHMTPDNKDVDAANILADLHLVLCLRC
jgi:hypothetical protein